MKETKVYVDELPKSCSYCPCFDVDNDECNITDCPVDYIGPSVAKPDDCPLIDIKTHDGELVKEVCEKIKLKFSDTRTHNWGIEQFELYEFLDQIQELEGEDE